MPEGFDDILLVGTVFVVVTLAAFWLAMVIWAYRDMRSRSRDPLAQLLVAIIVSLLECARSVHLHHVAAPRDAL